MAEVLPGNGLHSSLDADVTAGTTTLRIPATVAAAWPTGGEYRAVLCQDPINGPYELVKVTGGQGTTMLQVTRASEPYNGDQTARAWPAGTSISAVVTEDNLDQRLYVAIEVQEFVPAGGVTQITLARAPEKIVMVARNGVIQSQAAGHFSVAGPTLTFAASFGGTERLIVSYSVRGPA
jgi:hypothetical protein